MPRLDDKKRIKKLRENMIEAMKKAVVDEPQKYDPDRLQQAIDELNKVADDNLDAYLILGKHLAILFKQVEFTNEELDQIRSVFNELHCEVDLEKRGELDGRDRDDWYWRLNTPTIKGYLVHVTKWNAEKPYVLGAAGIGWGGLCDFGHYDCETLVKRIRCILNEDIKYGEA